MATVVFCSRPPIRCSFTVELLPFDMDQVRGQTEGEVFVRPYGAEVAFADPLDTLIGFRAFCEDAEWQRSKLRGWWLASLGSRAAVEMLRDDSELARHACEWHARWTGAPIAERGEGMLRFVSIIGVDEGIAPRELADDVLPDAGLVLCRAEGTTRELLHVTTSGFVIGRSPEDSDLAIPEVTVARRHVRFDATPTGWTVEDLASPSGVYVNETRGVGRIALGPGSLVRLGQVQLVVLAARPGESRMLR